MALIKPKNYLRTFRFYVCFPEMERAIGLAYAMGDPFTPGIVIARGLEPTGPSLLEIVRESSMFSVFLLDRNREHARRIDVSYDPERAIARLPDLDASEDASVVEVVAIHKAIVSGPETVSSLPGIP